MSSHREAPEISKDPVADNTDTYAFVSPDNPQTVTLITNYIPLQFPAGGPNFFEFGDDVLYSIHIDNDGGRKPDITFEFRFTTEVANPDTFLYNTGPIGSLGDGTWNRRQFYSVTRVDHTSTMGTKRHVLAQKLPCPPCNIGPRSTPNYAALANQAVHHLGGGTTVFAGQRLDGFYVDLGSVFDLGTLRPFENLHLIPSAAAVGVDGLRSFNVHTIALQVPIAAVTRNGTAPKDPMAREAVIGVWGAAARQRAHVRRGDDDVRVGAYSQVSRLGNPLFNEVIVPMGDKDRWNRLTPAQEDEFLKYVEHPELAGLLPVLYPGVFPNLAALTAPRADLVAILLTGIPGGIIPGFQNFTSAKPADMLRLNVAIPPAATPNVFGILGGDLAGFPNGRRVDDDIVAIELRAVAGATYPLVDKTYTPDAAAAALTDGSGPGSTTYLATFPYLDHPVSGYDVVPPNTASAA